MQVIGERVVWSGGEKTTLWRERHTRDPVLAFVATDNKNLANGRSLLLLSSSGWNAHVPLS